MVTYDLFEANKYSCIKIFIIILKLLCPSNSKNGRSKSKIFAAHFMRANFLLYQSPNTLNIPYPRERGPMGSAPYIGSRLRDGAIFEVSVWHLDANEHPGKLSTLSS